MAMIPDWLWLMIILMAGMIAWRIWGTRIKAAVKRFDQRRMEEDRQLIADAQNPIAHFRRSIDSINDRVESVRVARDGSATWRGQSFTSANEAEDARWRHVIEEARAFYTGLDEDFGLRIAGPRRPPRNPVEPDIVRDGKP